MFRKRLQSTSDGHTQRSRNQGRSGRRPQSAPRDVRRLYAGGWESLIPAAHLPNGEELASWTTAVWPTPPLVSDPAQCLLLALAAPICLPQRMARRCLLLGLGCRRTSAGSPWSPA
jgi:hypothetical protein